MGINKNLIVPVLVWIGVVGAVLVIVTHLTGCAAITEEKVWQRVCYEQFLGKADNGLLVVRHYCVSEEALKGEK